MLVRDFLRALRVGRRHAPWLGAAVLGMVLVAAATVFSYNLIRPVYDQLLRPEAAVATPVPGPEGGLVGWLDGLVADAQRGLQAWAVGRRGAILGLILIAVLVKNLFAYVSRYAGARFGLATARDLRVMVFDSLLGQGPGYFHRTTPAVLVSRVVHDLGLVTQVLAERLGDLLQDVLTLAAVLLYLFSLDFRLAAVTMAVAPVLLLPVVHFSRRLRHRSRQSQERMGDLAGVLDESLRGIRIVQAYGAEAYESARFARASQHQFVAGLRARAVQAANAPVMELVGAAAAAALIGYASSQIAAGRTTLGDFSAFLLGVYGSYTPLKRLNKFNLALQQASVAAERVFEVVDAPVQVREKQHAVALDDVAESVRFAGVSFAYEPGRWVLREVDLEVRRGTTVALVGPSGAGKSTIAQLIPRFWDVQEGAVLVGGRDIRGLTLRSLRSHIGLVTQETVLFNDTVRGNIAFGLPEVAEERLLEAARAARAHGFITALPEGYDTVIGEGGARLSGGQRQRLAIARALLRDPDILILDEATSSLDPPSERLVQRALEELMRDRTTLLISHRLASVRGADCILVLDAGRVVERGDHDGLMAKNGLYRRLVEAQEIT